MEMYFVCAIECRVSFLPTWFC